MRPTVRVAITGVPPRSRRKAAEGIRARPMRPLWEKNGDERSREEEEARLGLGFGEGEREEEGEKVGKLGADMEEEMKARWRENWEEESSIIV